MKISSWCLLAAVLGAGIAIGASYERRMLSGALADPAASRSPMDPASVMNILDRELRLDARQHDSIAAIFSRRQAAIDSAWHVLKPGIRAAMDSSEMEIVDVLRPDQVPIFLRLLATSHPRTAAPR